MKKILLIVQEYYPKDFRVRRISENLVRMNFNVDVLCIRDKNQEPFEMINGVRVFRINLLKKRGSTIRYIFEYTFFAFIVFLRCSHLFLKYKYTTIIVNNPPDFLSGASTRCRWL